MYIDRIKVSNFRLLKDFQINVDDTLSLIIGKNNTGKTSFLAVLEKFLLTNQNTFSFDDFNLESKSTFKNDFEAGIADMQYTYGIELKLYLGYSEDDDLEYLSKAFLDLDAETNFVVLQFSYIINKEQIDILAKDLEDFNEEQEEEKDVLFYLKETFSKYFDLKIKSLEYGNEENNVEINDPKLINKIINFKRIKAKRDVLNSDGLNNKSDRALSKKSSRYYDKLSKASESNVDLNDLKKSLGKADQDLNEVYEKLFEGILGKVKKFSGLSDDEAKIQIRSTLEGKNILKDNTSVIYDQGGQSLPEDYYGLGYLNLISMIFEIEVVIYDFKKKNNKFEKPSSINLFFIEEPEAHTHPQMQYIFIKNIKDLLDEERMGDEDDVEINLQTIISSHSSHIVAESEFEDIKYFKRETINSIISKDLKELIREYEGDEKQYEFLKKYLTLNRAELFFADKAILIEGPTERILLPTLMKKVDLENKVTDKENGIVPLTSQNISIVEVGAYFQIFEKFIDFIGAKCIVITDIDFIDENGACERDNATGTSNSGINFFFNGKSIDEILNTNIEDKIFKKVDEEWIADEDGLIMMTFQTEDDNYFPRSFEDAFINNNREFIRDNRDDFTGLKNAGRFDNEDISPYDLAEGCIKKKTDFALDIIYLSNSDFSNWSIPSYIKEGLLWLK